LPKDTWDFPESTSWPDEWIGNLQIKLDDVVGKTPISTLKGWIPYVLLAIFLVASRTVEPLRVALTSVNLNWTNIFGETGVSGGLQPLYL
ncbi:L-lactate permease, partial [Guyparkeria sp. 1SP6A2]|nr:L-lactate permease [Guyparkeria sp. 1SP6A2]